MPANRLHIRHISVGCKTVFAGKRAPTRVDAASTDAHSDDSGASHSSTTFGPEPNTDPRSPKSASAEGVGARLPANGRYIRHISVGCKTVFAGKRAPTRNGSDTTAARLQRCAGDATALPALYLSAWLCTSSGRLRASVHQALCRNRARTSKNRCSRCCESHRL